MKISNHLLKSRRCSLVTNPVVLLIRKLLLDSNDGYLNSKLCPIKAKIQQKKYYYC